MGRLPGVKNKRTLIREQNLRDAAVNASNRLSGVGLLDKEDCLAVMEDSMSYFYRKAVRENNKGKDTRENVVRECILDAALIARSVLPHRYPTLAAIHTSTSKQTALNRPGSVEQEIYAELMAEIAQSGELPRQVKAYLSKPPKDGNGSGGNNGSGGVANR